MLKQRHGLADLLSVQETKLLVDGLGALLRERSVAFEIARDAAVSRGQEGLDVRDFGLPDILRLSRLLST
ncbi:hypothetical protein CIC12_20210 [Burkholderia sp. SG-MS1]|nr:hypothetical protein [Paraburkholderia sp. SG-MS1]